jgi:hypothetical protein
MSPHTARLVEFVSRLVRSTVEGRLHWTVATPAGDSSTFSDFSTILDGRTLRIGRTIQEGPRNGGRRRVGDGLGTHYDYSLDLLDDFGRVAVRIEDIPGLNDLYMSASETAAGFDGLLDRVLSDTAA